MPTRFSRAAAAGLIVSLALAACGGSAASPSASTAPAASAEPSALASTEPSGSPAESPAGSPAASGSADIMVDAVDFKFENVPAEIKSGTTLGLTNTGQEVHEMVVVRKLPTTTQSFEELLAMPGDEAQKYVQDVGFAMALPGQTSTDTVTLGEPGDYLMLCFIPAGTTSLPSLDPNSSEAPSLGTGAPHFTLGMQQEFTVTE